MNIKREVLPSNMILFGEPISQQSKTGFLSLTILHKIYNKEYVSKGYSEKRIAHILTDKNSIDRLFYILEKQEIIHTKFPTFEEEISAHKGFLRYLKKIEVYKQTGTKKNTQIWCNPYIWLFVAKELHLDIFIVACQWMKDKAIRNRIDAGYIYQGLTSSVSKLKGVDYIVLAKSLNNIIFGLYELEMRNRTSLFKLEEMLGLEKNLTYSIDMGLVTSWEQLLSLMSKTLEKKSLFYMDKILKSI